jgi:hypothetical protein
MSLLCRVARRVRLGRCGHRRLLRPGACVVVDVVVRAFDAIPDNEYMTDDWKLPRSQRRPTQYKIRMSRDQVVERARASGFQVGAFLPGTQIPPRFVAVLSRP